MSRKSNLTFVLLAALLINNLSANAGQPNEKTFCFEFITGYSLSNYKTTSYNKVLWTDMYQDSIKGVKAVNRNGLIFGIQKNIKINYRSIFRVGLVANYYPKAFEYNMVKSSKTINAMAFDLPVHFVYGFKSNKTPKQTYPYLIIGGKYSYNRTLETANYYFQPANVSIDTGIGVRIFANKNYLMGAEIRYSLGLRNNIYNNNNAVTKLFRNGISLLLNIS